MQTVEEGSKKCVSFRMCLSLSDYQFKTSRYRYRSTYMSPIVTTNQRHIIDTQKLERKEDKHTSNKNHQTTREETKGRTEKNYGINWKTSNKMAISTYLSIISLNVNRLNAPIKRHRVADWTREKRKQDSFIYMLT